MCLLENCGHSETRLLRHSEPNALASLLLPTEVVSRLVCERWNGNEVAAKGCFYIMSG